MSGDSFDGYQVEELRTDPFYLSLNHSPNNLHRKTWTPRGEKITAIIETINTIFNGRADLVLALRDDSGKGWLQVVDAKTKQCLHGFNPTSPLEGNELQIVVDEDSPLQPRQPRKKSSLNILQLMLYSLALEISERSKPDNLRREILPPAIQISASGRMIRMRDEDYKQARIDLISLVEWCGEIAAVDEGIKAPERLPMDKLSTCEKCPFYRGQSSYAALLVRSSAHHDQSTWKIFLSSHLVYLNVFESCIKHSRLPFINR